MDGIPIEDRRTIRRMIGYLPQEFSFYPSLSVYEAMDYLALLSGIMDSGTRKKRIGMLLERMNLADCLQGVSLASLPGIKVYCSGSCCDDLSRPLV